MANYTPPASFSASHATTTSQAPSSTLLPSEISPSALDTLPILTAILTRLQTGTANSTSTTAAANTSQSILPPQNGSPHISQSQSQPFQATAAGSTSSPFPSSSAATHNTKEHLQNGPLTTKDIPAATDDLKSGLKRARAQVAGLPDMERGVEEQEVEIQELEAKIREQRGVLEGLKAMGGGGEVEA